MAPDRVAVAFVRALRDAGLDVPVGATVTFSEALAEIGFLRESSLYWTGRATLVTRVEAFPVYDRVFEEFWHRRFIGDALELPAERSCSPSRKTRTRPSKRSPTTPKPFPRLVVGPARSSAAQEGLRRVHGGRAPRDPAAPRRPSCDARPCAALADCGPCTGTATLATRTSTYAPPCAGRCEPEANRCSSLVAGRARAPRRLVLLLDVSGSMDPYTRALLRFAHSAVAGGRASRPLPSARA